MRKIDWMAVCIYTALVLWAVLLFIAIWYHDIAFVIMDVIWIVCGFVWSCIWRDAKRCRKENEFLRSITEGLIAGIASRNKMNKDGDHEPNVPAWRMCKAGYKFDSDAIVIGLGEDKDPRLVRCAVNDCSYILVKDLIKKLPVIEENDAAK